MDIDARQVSTALNRGTRALLREHGFTRFRGRNAWRTSAHSIDLISMRFIGSLHDAVGCTSYSFGLEAGSYYPSLASAHAEREVEWPRDYDLTIRGSVGKSIVQPLFHQGFSIDSEFYDGIVKTDRADIWYVMRDGSNLKDVVEDVVSTLIAIALPFVERSTDPARAAVLRDSDSILWEFDQHSGALQPREWVDTGAEYQAAIPDYRSIMVWPGYRSVLARPDSM